MTILKGSALPPRSGTAKSILVLLHGYGANGDDLLSIGQEWAALLPDTVFAAPNAPDICEVFGGGFQWFGLRTQDGPLTKEGLDRKELIQKPAAALNAYLDALLTEWMLDDSHLVVAGFSQGAMMVMYAMPRRKKPCAGVIGWSGMLIDAPGLLGADIVKMPVLAIHGDEDGVVPPLCLDGVREGFEGAGFEVEAIMRPRLGHGIDQFGLARSLEFVQEAFQK